MGIHSVKKQQRLRRGRAIRYRIKQKERIRLGVYRSARHIYAYIVTPEGQILATASTLDKYVRAECKGYSGNVDSAKLVGKYIAIRAKKAGITQVVFDRAGYRFHGRVAALANAARECGLDF